MENAFAWLQKIFDYFWQFIPQTVIFNTTEGAVKFQTVRLRDLIRFKWDPVAKPVVLTPGFHIYWPVVTELKAWVVARQSVDLPTQTITTKDHKTVAIGGVVIFRIADPFKLITDAYNPDEIVRDLAQGVIHSVTSGVEWVELHMAASDGSLNKALLKEMRKRLKRFGVLVFRVVLTDFAQTKVLKLIQTTHQDSHD